MLNIREICDEEIASSLETDFYVPVSIELPSNDTGMDEVYLYLLYGENGSFVETTVNSKSQRICEVTAVSVNKLTDCGKVNFDFLNLPEEIGNPIIETSIWDNETVLDDHAGMRVIYDAGNLYFLPPDEKMIAKRLRMTLNLVLLLDDGQNIIGYMFTDIPEEKRSEMLKGIKTSTSNYEESHISDNTDMN